jgi:hypothetical protein
MAPVTPAARRGLNAAAIVLVLTLVYAFAVGLRWQISSTIETAVKPPTAEDLPYTLESALLFHYADEYRKTGRIPRVDERAQVPEAFHVHRDLSLGKGIVAAWLYNGLGVRGVSFQRFVRRFDAAWYCLSVVPLFLLVWGRTRRLLPATLAALLLAGAYTAVVRSTGIEFSRENFALPLIFAHFWLFDTALRTRRLGPSIAAGVVLAVALATWDLTQLYLLLIVAYWAVRCLVRRAAAAQLGHLAPTIAAGVIAGLAVPYLWAHRFLVSYAMLAGYGLMAWWALETFVKRPRLPGLAAKLALAVVLVGMLAAASALPAGKTYGHFRELFFAKLEHKNVKPEEPERLSYDARILWTPALHSATTKHLGRRPITDFRALFTLGLIAAACVLAAKLKRRTIGEVGPLVAMVLVWLALYVLFVRMQVFLVFFLAAFIGIGVGAVAAMAKRQWPVVLAALVVAFFLISDLSRGILFTRISEEYKVYVPASRYILYESADLNKLHQAYGRNFPYAGAAELIRWLRANTPEDAVVLSSFSLQPTIYEYAGRRIVLHPKFESPAMRDKVRAFLESFFAPSEREFHAFCVRNKADYFVLNLGMFAGPDAKGWIYSPRYFVALTGDMFDTVGTSWMYAQPEKCGYFRFETEIGARGERLPLYRVFTVVTQGEIRQAEELTAFGAWFLESYMQSKEAEDLALAVEALERAVELWPGSIEAYKLMISVSALLGNEARAFEAKSRWEELKRQEQ